MNTTQTQPQDANAEFSPLVMRLCRWTRGMMWFEKWAAIAMLAVMVVAMASQVVARYGFGSPIPWSEELARFVMIWLAFFAASHVMAQRGHISVDLFSGPSDSGSPGGGDVGTTKSGRGAQAVRHGSAWSDFLVGAIVLAVCSVLLFGSLRFVWQVHPVHSPALDIPRSLWYAAVSVGLALMAFHSLVDLILIASCGHTYSRLHQIIDSTPSKRSP